MELLKVVNKNCNLSLTFAPETFYIKEVQHSKEQFFCYEYDYHTIKPTGRIYNETNLIGIFNNIICFHTSDFWKGSEANFGINVLHDFHTGNKQESYKTNKWILPKEFQKGYFVTKSYHHSENMHILEAFNPFIRDTLWQITNKNPLNVDCFWEGSFIFIQHMNVNCHSSLSGKKLWEYDLRKYFKRTIPTYANNEPMYTIEVEKVVYNPAFNSLLLSITPNIKVSLDANTGNLLWEAENYPTSGPYYVMDQETGHTHYFTLEIGRGQATDQVFYHVMDGATGELLHSRDFTEDLQIPTTKIDQICMKPQMGAFKDNYLYFTLGDLGRLYQMNKHTYKVVKFDEQEDVYYESMPVVYKNRLFLIEDNDIKKLWVFEV